MELSHEFRQLYNKFKTSKEIARFYIDFLKSTRQDEELKDLKNYDHKKDAFIDDIQQKKKGKRRITNEVMKINTILEI